MSIENEILQEIYLNHEKLWCKLKLLYQADCVLYKVTRSRPTITTVYCLGIVVFLQTSRSLDSNSQLRIHKMMTDCLLYKDYAN